MYATHTHYQADTLRGALRRQLGQKGPVTAGTWHLTLEKLTPMVMAKEELSYRGARERLIPILRDVLRVINPSPRGKRRIVDDHYVPVDMTLAQQ